MKVDVAVVGAPFLDITLEGLPRVPAPGEELVGGALHFTPGGTGIQAIGLARLGVSVALVAPIGDDPAGRILRRLLEDEGVRLVGRAATATPVTALFPTAEGTAMASFVPSDEPDADDVASANSDAVVLSLGRLHLAPPGATVYAVTGPGEVDHVAGGLRNAERRPHAVICNAREAAVLTGYDQPEAAATELARFADSAVVTLGADGAVASDGSRAFRSPAPDVDAVDATGAGDLFVAAYVWSDLRGDDLEHRVALATLYAGLSVNAPTALAGALDEPTLVSEANRTTHG